MKTRNEAFAVIANIPGTDAYIFQTADGSWSEPVPSIVDAMAVAPKHSYAEATGRAMTANAKNGRRVGRPAPHAIAWAGAA